MVKLFYLSSTGVFVINLFLCLIEAQKSRRIPAFFNESERVIGALLSSLFVTCMGISVMFVTNEPTAYPDAPYIMEVFHSLFHNRCPPTAIGAAKAYAYLEGRNSCHRLHFAGNTKRRLREERSPFPAYHSFTVVWRAAIPWIWFHSRPKVLRKGLLVFPGLSLLKRVVQRDIQLIRKGVHLGQQ